MIVFKVPGLPVAQGSKTALPNPRGGRPILVESAKGLKPWRRDVKLAALSALNGRPPFHGAVTVLAEFTFPRPKSHHVAGDRARPLKPGAPARHTSKPDGDKLVRAVFDALTDAGVVEDDCKVSDHAAFKRYGASPSAFVVISSGELDVAAVVRSVIHTDAETPRQEGREP